MNTPTKFLIIMCLAALLLIIGYGVFKKHDFQKMPKPIAVFNLAINTADRLSTPDQKYLKKTMVIPPSLSEVYKWHQTIEKQKKISK